MAVDDGGESERNVEHDVDLSLNCLSICLRCQIHAPSTRDRVVSACLSEHCHRFWQEIEVQLEVIQAVQDDRICPPKFKTRH